jgi:hypothetical protein
MMGGGDKSSSTQTSKVELPPWVNEASQSNYKFAQGVAGRPYEAYGGKTVAPLAPGWYEAKGMLPQLGQNAGDYEAAQGTLTGLLNTQAQNVTGQGYDPRLLANTSLTPYMNPYTDEVERRAITNATRQGQQAQRDLASDITRKGAFGGSRQAIQSAVQGAETTRGIGDLSAQLRQQNFTQAQQAAGTDVAAQNAAAQFGAGAANTASIENAHNALTAAGLSKAAADSLVTAAQAGDASALQHIQAVLGMATMQQEQTQREYDDRQGKWQKKHDYPLEQLNILMSALGMSPYGQTTTTTGQQTQKTGMDFGGLLGGAGGLLKGLMPLFGSDRSMKTDITKLGTDAGTGLPMYAYRYKGDPKSYPKVVGPMAQDIEKVAPKLVRKVAGKRVIDLTELAT